MRTLTLFGISLILIATSCKPKLEHTVIQGYVKTFGSEWVHPGIEIELNEEFAGVTLLDKTTTNSDGWFQLEGEFDKSKSHYLYLNNTPPLHEAANNWGYNAIQVNTGGVQRVDIELHPFSWIKFHFKNINPCSTQDFLVYRSGIEGAVRIYGALTDTYKVWETYGNNEIVFNYSVVKCGVQTNFKKQIGLIAPFDTIEYQILY